MVQPMGAFRVDDAALDEPREGVAERRQTLERETILEVVGVQEIEGVLEVDVVGVVAARRRRIAMAVVVSISLTTI